MATARKVRDRKFPQADFEMSVADAVAQLIKPAQIAPGDVWTFSVDGDVLNITRTRSTEVTPIPPEDV